MEGGGRNFNAETQRTRRNAEEGEREAIENHRALRTPSIDAFVIRHSSFVIRHSALTAVVNASSIRAAAIVSGGCSFNCRLPSLHARAGRIVAG